MKVADIMSQDVVVVGVDSTIKEIAEKIVSKDITGMPVVDGDTIVGIVTEDDIIKHEAHVDVPEIVPILSSFLYLDDPSEFEDDLQKVLATTAKELMTDKVVTVSPKASIEELATLFNEHDVNPIPVEEDGVLVGIVSKSDIVALIMRADG